MRVHVQAASPTLRLMEADDDNDEIPLDPPPAQPVLEGELLKKRIDAVVATPALWNRLEIRLGDLLEELGDLDDSLKDDELQSLFTVTIIALGAMHPVVAKEYDPDPYRMSAWYEEEIATGPADEKMGAYMEALFLKTAQPQVASAAAGMLAGYAEDKKIRDEKLEQLITAVCAAIWEAAHWPVDLNPELKN